VDETLERSEILDMVPRDKNDNPRLGGIRLFKKLGEGGMAIVYYGVHPRLRNEVAIKILFPSVVEKDPTIVRRFYNEAQVAVQINTEHLVRVFDVNEEAGLHYMVQEFVSGTSAWGFLREAIKEGYAGLPEASALAIVTASTRGLVEAHKREIIHRDLKPDNILLPRRYGEHTLDLDAAKLADLGLAKSNVTDGSLEVRENISMGTPGFVSPEQALDSAGAGPAADVFSMGATLATLLTGQPPFTGSTPMEVLVNTAQNRREPIKKFRPDLHKDTIALIDRCLRPEQGERFLDAVDLLKALEDIPRADKPAPQTRATRSAGNTQILPGGGIQGKQLLDEARALLRAGKTEAAENSLRAVLERDPDNFDAQQLMRRMRGMQGTLQIPKTPTTQTSLPTSIPTPQDPTDDGGMFKHYRTYSGHERWVRCVNFSDDGKKMVTASDDKTARIWDTRTGEELRVLGEHPGPMHHGSILTAAFNADGTKVVTAAQDGSARVWNAATGDVLQLLEHPNWVNAAVFSPDEKLVATACVDGHIRLWDADSGKQRRLLAPHGRNVNTVSFSRDGKRIATSSNDKTACVHDAETFRVLVQISGHRQAVNGASFSHGGTRLITVSDDMTVCIWESATGNLIQTLEGHTSPVLHGEFIDRQFVLTASDDGTARVWDLLTAETVQVIAAHQRPVRWVCARIDGRIIATAGEDQTARVWKLRS
jgi:WD40 repeat protein